MVWFGAVMAVVVLVGSMASYAFHARAHYEAIDRALLNAAAATAADPAASAHLGHLTARQGVAMTLRVYDAGGQLVQRLPDDAAPAVDPRVVLARPAGPAYGFFPGLAPSIVDVPQGITGAFATLHDGHQRWRVFVHPVERGGDATGAGPGYVVALAPLGGLDASMADFRVLLTGLGALGLVVAVAGSWAVAGSALRPVARLTEAARAIAASRDLSRRVQAAGRDELAMLAATFNEMLESIETAYRLQQRFVSDASHELRAPLTAILGNLDLLRRRPDLPPEEQAQALEEARREAERLSRLVADLLALARADAGVPLVRKAVDVDAVVLDAFQEARRLAKGQQLVLDPLEPVRIQGDADRIKQLLLILLDNAIKYTPAGGRIVLGLQDAGGDAVLTVADTGVGIPAADLPHVFERFYRADPARSRDPGGTGLGLPIARWIVEQHGGSIAIDSAPGQGTTVTVRLPGTGAGAVQGAGAATAAAS
ncbi:integral membrane sensor signal transduction histidine kinase [Thermaerobacter marianensis DSM 12885]|uniref:histidine kinase n=1 Tax=Thermaerobacter marianensis (strain ATCC 700841 / DSM 12885 / JCM 10246 / 7p75a) TaxID=644966 RepID=E6SII1_THEM7|nr:HAMP domain-containing sensor histidine kinase [Thermaerobacter marianensis]ADU50887.1 integral membrane sensor signal transduction histidine kinase [Thermaerobacter marianensis DSM 12885]